MKKIAISTLAVLIACPAFAGNTNDMWGLNPYMGLRGGLAYSNTNYGFNGSTESMTDMTFQGRAALGLEITDTYRTELEWSLYSKSKDTGDFGGTNAEVQTKLQTLLMNTYMEFNSYSMVHPFIGVGAGIAFSSVERNLVDLPTHTNDKTGFSATGIMGMTFDMQQFAVDIAARYTYVDVQSGLHNFGGDIGIRFMF